MSKQETNINNHYDYDLADNFNRLAGGNKEKCEKIIENVSQKHVEHSTHLDGEVMGDLRHVNKIINIGDLERPAIDVKKLLIPLHVDRTLYQTEEELFKALTDWWINIKHRSPKTITIRIRHARNMSQHQIYPVNWLEFQPEQILNQMLFRQIYEYPEMAKKIARLSKERLNEILELLSSNYQERQKLDLLPRCWYADEFFSVKANQKLWNKVKK